MRILSIAVVALIAFSSCKSHKNAASASGPSSATALTATATGATTGKVSHRFREGGCATVISVIQEDGTEMILIPKDKLPADLDVDGQTITFDYTPLRMPQPQGCTTGIPASLSAIAKK